MPYIDWNGTEQEDAEWDVMTAKQTQADVHIVAAPIAVLKGAAFSLLAIFIDTWEPYGDPDKARELFSFVEGLVREASQEDRDEVREAVLQTAGICGVWY